MDSVSVNKELRKSLILYAQFQIEHDALFARLSADKDSLHLPGLQEFNFKFNQIKKAQLERIIHSGGHVADVMCEQAINFSDSSDNREKLERIASSVNADLRKEFPFGAEFAVDSHEGQLTLVVYTNHALINAVLDCIERRRVFRDILERDKFVEITPDNRFVCGLRTEDDRLNYMSDQNQEANARNRGFGNDNGPQFTAM